MKREHLFSWDPESGVASCIITYRNKTFYGMATCHDDDRDMMSEKTGCEIAYRRASLAVLRDYRDNEIKPGLAALKQLYYSINKSKNYNQKSYESKMLYRQICLKENDLVVINEIIDRKKQELNDLIKNKDEFYKKIRKNRKANLE